MMLATELLPIVTELLPIVKITNISLVAYNMIILTVNS